MDRRAVETLGDGWYLIDDGETRWRVAVANDANATWVFVNGRVARIENEARDTRTSGRKRGEAGVMSPMPATVVAIHAIPGQAVTEGETD